jgi:hypothetical protein
VPLSLAWLYGAMGLGGTLLVVAAVIRLIGDLRAPPKTT